MNYYSISLETEHREIESHVICIAQRLILFHVDARLSLYILLYVLAREFF
jgi:hypothetical protein